MSGVAKSKSSVLALAGGVGGAKLAFGLDRLLGQRLTVLVNTGDDFEHLGLLISPDLDTVMYTLAGIANPETGWGIAGESWNFMDQLVRIGGPGWFRLGDRDLATHAFRTARLHAGESLTAVTAELCRRLQVRARLLPMSDERVNTIVHTPEGALEFQDYFVRRKAQIPVSRIEIRSAINAAVTPDIAAVMKQELSAIVICPSNPYLSVDPILSVGGLGEWLASTTVPIVAVSPIIGGEAVKGPAARIMADLGISRDVLAVARHYHGLIDGIVIDKVDEEFTDVIESEGIRVHVTRTLMRNEADRIALAGECLAFADRLHSERYG